MFSLSEKKLKLRKFCKTAIFESDPDISKAHQNQRFCHISNILLF